MATRPPEDDACEDLLIDHEAERLDLSARILAHAAPQFAASSRKIVELLRVKRPSAARVARAREEFDRALLLAFISAGNDLKNLVGRQTIERVETFARRSSHKLITQPITAARMRERKEKIEAARAPLKETPE